MAQQARAGGRLDDDLTAKARIRNAALELFAREGDAASLRRVASAAGVTVGLIVHHYGTKDALRQAVDLAVVDEFAEAIASVPIGSVPDEEIVAARDAAVARMLQSSPALVDYLRRAVLDASAGRGDLLRRLSRLSARQVHELREAGVISTSHPVGEQVMTVMVRQLGRLFLQPLVDNIADQFADDLDGTAPPQLVVSLARRRET